MAERPTAATPAGPSCGDRQFAPAKATENPGEAATQDGPGSRMSEQALIRAASRARDRARLALLWLAGADMRIAVLALPPVLPQIRRELHLSEGTVGILTTLPVLLLALGAVGGSAAVARLGPRRALALGLVVVGASSALRGADGAPALFLASIALGAGIAVLQPTMPSMTRLWFPSRVGFATSVYTNGIVAGEAAAASLTIPFVLPLAGSWQVALAFWGLPALLAAALLAAPFAKVQGPPMGPPLGIEHAGKGAPATTPTDAGERALSGVPTISGGDGPRDRGVPAMILTGTGNRSFGKPSDLTPFDSQEDGGAPATTANDRPATGRLRHRSRWWPQWDDAITWRVGLLQGGGSVVYFGTNAYLPTELHTTGRAGVVAACLAALNASQLLASLLVAVLARRSVRPRWLLAACGSAALLGLAALVWAPGELAVGGCVLIGVSSAICFIVSLAMPALLVPPDEVHKMAAATTTIGYVAAFALPLAGGLAWDATGQAALAFAPAAAGAAALGLALLVPGRSGKKLAGVRLR
jgi:cyanate permease